MSLVNAPFGIIPAYHPSGEIRSVAHPGVLLPGTNVNIFKGQPVFLAIGTGAAVNGVTIPAGQVYLAPVVTLSAAQKILGVFAGVEYFDNTGAPQETNCWIASTQVFTNTIVTAWIWEDPEIVYSAQVDGALTVGSPAGQPYAYFDGRETMLSNPTAGSTATGLSQATISAANITATTVQGQFQLVKIDPSILNQSPADAFPTYQVRIANPQNKAPFASI